MTTLIDGIETSLIVMKKGEIKNTVFNFTDKDGAAADISGDTLLLEIKEEKGGTALITKLDVDFARIDDNSASVIIDTSVTTAMVKYYAEIKIVFADGTVDKTETFYLYIEPPVIT